MESCEIPRWQVLKSFITNLEPEAFKMQLHQTKQATLLDVRTEEEIKEQSLEGALHLDYLSEGFLDQLELMDRDGHYFVYCRTGRRSIRTGILMRNWGFKHIFNLEGGLVAWDRVYKQQME